MTNAYYTKTYDVSPGTRVGSQAIEDQYLLIQQGFDGVAASVATLTSTKGAITDQTWTGTHIFPSTVTIGNVSDVEIGHLDGVTSAIQTQINTLAGAKGVIAGQTWTGTHDYTSATLTAATQTPGDNTTKVATTAFATALAFAAALPSQTGNPGKFVTTDGTTASWALAIPDQTSNSGKYLTTDGTNASWASTTPTLLRTARTSNTMLAATDNSTLIDITSGTFTQTFDAAATLADGWFCYLRNSGAGIITLDPNGSDLIDGIAARTLTAKQTVLVICTGAGFVTVAIEGVGDHEVVVHTGPAGLTGSGSTNSYVRRFTTTFVNVGTAITYADNSALGSTFTINESGLYSINYSDGNASNAGVQFGVSINYSNPVSFIGTPIANKLMVTTNPAINRVGSVSRVVRLATGDVLRPHSENMTMTTNEVFFAIRKVGV